MQQLRLEERSQERGGNHGVTQMEDDDNHRTRMQHVKPEQLVFLDSCTGETLLDDRPIVSKRGSISAVATKTAGLLGKEMTSCGYTTSFPRQDDFSAVSKRTSIDRNSVITLQMIILSSAL